MADFGMTSGPGSLSCDVRDTAFRGDFRTEPWRGPGSVKPPEEAESIYSRVLGEHLGAQLGGMPLITAGLLEALTFLIPLPLDLRSHMVWTALCQPRPLVEKG